MSFLPIKAVFLDRDGVINRKAPEGDYIRKWREIQLLPGAVNAVATLNRAGFKVFVVTNQRGVALSKVRIEDLLEIHDRVRIEFARGGALISQIYYCPHDIQSMCACRKPKPGMLHRAAAEHNVDLKASWMVGDSISDVKAGESAGCSNVLLASSVPSVFELKKLPLLADSLESAVSLMLKEDAPKTTFVRTQSDQLSRSSLCEDV